MLKELFGKVLKCKNKLNKKKEENKEQGKKETKLEKEKMEGNLPTGNIDNIGEGKETSPPF